MADRAPPPNNHPPANPRNNRPARHNPLARPEGNPPRGRQRQAPANLDRENPGMPEQNQERPGWAYFERLIRLLNETLRNQRMLEQNRADPAIIEVARGDVRQQIARAPEPVGPPQGDAQDPQDDHRLVQRPADPQENKENDGAVGGDQ
ncbi:hypothetical protein CAEBREN_04644 [Caenorhabditis brenneri]|uniref:Uncharacterized protein n=1 Tax=Caenorhabditis brenneri TaxID=135651 RepID=G0NKF7_CAEBE|nr:hypothetical protein CAEBREN_04644 [Caenorhabditis brenneri]